jgi:pimeloyl-ACP methyl ester carboxylesterase
VQLLSSSDGVTVALHDFGGAGSALLISHATGFHAHCYAPIAGTLAGDFHAHGLDYRGHGYSTQPSRWDGEPVDWRGCGDDAVLAAETTAPGGGIVGFGHSMGGAALLMAAARRPELFDRLVLFEPIVPPPMPEQIDPDQVPLVRGARRRKARFESIEAAYENYRSKPPLSWFDDTALRAYVDHGFRQMVSGNDGEVELRCAPLFEAATFEGSFANGVWELLPSIGTPTLVITGVVEGDQPSRFAADIADRLPNGTYLELPHMTHFGPFTHIAEVAALVRAT